jgi:hypothetical protein
MSRSGAVIQVILVVLILVYSTFHFYKGNFELGFSALPILMLYYVLVVGRSRRFSKQDDDEPDMDRHSR